ncbi:MAG: hypothetical protein Q9183_002620, partial [Haloplaca sp. 2 TL-2023]
MADDLEEAEDERAIELDSISAIYPELVVDSTDPFSASIDVPVDLIKPLDVSFPLLADGAAPAGLPTPPDSHDQEILKDGDVEHRPQFPTQGMQESHQLSHLPPLRLHIALPAGYPTDEPPQLDLATDVAWLPVDILEKLKDDGVDMWEEMGRSQVLFAYIDHLREASENGFGLGKSNTEPLRMSPELKLELLDFDIKAKSARFDAATFDCGVCLEPKKGAVCHRMSLCGHVFCVECLQDFFNNCITEGDVTNVKCIAPNCGHVDSKDAISQTRRKRDRTLGPSELLQIPLTQEIVQRYVMLKRKQALESDRTTVYCPRQWCQGPARSKKTEALDRNLDLDSDAEDAPEQTRPQAAQDQPMPPAERLAICTDCTFAFCKVCKASWHGEFLICDPQRKAKLTEEEQASEEYLKLHTSPCPTCDARCQKTHGCNHMICFKCNTHFCYLCSSWLDNGNPYEHYNNPKKSCYMRLWELKAGDEANGGHGFAGGRDGAAGLHGDFVDDDDDDDEPHEEGLVLF